MYGVKRGKRACLTGGDSYLSLSKWINTARIIDVKSHLDKNSNLFREIKERVKQCLD